MDQVYSQGTDLSAAWQGFNALLETPRRSAGGNPWSGTLIMGLIKHRDFPSRYLIAFQLPVFEKYSQGIRGRFRSRSFHDLTSWAEQGCFLLNACLTVPAGQANGHAGQFGTFYRCCDWVLNQKVLLSLLLGWLCRKKKALVTNQTCHYWECPSSPCRPLSWFWRQAFFKNQCLPCILKANPQLIGWGSKIESWKIIFTD